MGQKQTEYRFRKPESISKWRISWIFHFQVTNEIKNYHWVMAAEILNCLFCHNSAATCVKNKRSTHLESRNEYLNATSLGVSNFWSQTKSRVIILSWLLTSLIVCFAITLQPLRSERNGEHIKKAWINTYMAHLLVFPFWVHKRNQELSMRHSCSNPELLVLP